MKEIHRELRARLQPTTAHCRGKARRFRLPKERAAAVIQIAQDDPLDGAFGGSDGIEEAAGDGPSDRRDGERQPVAAGDFVTAAEASPE